MSGGMRIDPRELPLHMREQVAVKMLEYISKAQPVAGHGNETVRRVPVRKYKLTGARAVQRYETLRSAAHQGVISDLRIEKKDGVIAGFSYRIQWTGEFLPTGIPHKTIWIWQRMIQQQHWGTRVLEPITIWRENHG